MMLYVEQFVRISYAFKFARSLEGCSNCGQGLVDNRTSVVSDHQVKE